MSIDKKFLIFKKRERGAAALIVVVILLALLTITVLTVSRSTVNELRTSSNQNRDKEAFASAQAGLDRGSQEFLVTRTAVSNACSTLSATGAAYCYSTVVSGGEATVTGTGNSLDGSGENDVTEVFTISGMPGFGDLVPFLASGNVPTGGGFTLVPNPNAGGDGVPVAVWSKSAGTSGLSSWDVCEYDEYINNLCTGSAGSGEYLCKKGVESDCSAFVEDTGVPDPFATLFNVSVDGCIGKGGPGSDCPVDAIRQSYKGYFECPNISNGPVPSGGLSMDDALEAAKSNGIMGLPVIWIEGDCDIKNDIGSANSPVIIVIEGDVSLQGGNTFGIIFAMTDDYDVIGLDPSNSGDYNLLKYNGNAIINGAVLTNNNITQTNGGGVVAYSPDVLNGLTQDAEDGVGLIRARGSWRDF